ncbi:Sodium/glutamate symporter [Candidatus Sulfopaludibacter sp. SbA6]|nr:Sodium/glutamate symporter [Candidatus Sulfopaludibacter sp. SbA6]
MIPAWKLSAADVLGLACLGVLIGAWLKRKLPLLERLNIPVSIAGGMVFALAALLLRDRWVNLEPDTVLRDMLMVAFMTTIGLSARVQFLKDGGGKVVKLLVISSIGAVLQNLLGMGIAKVLAVDVRLGILAGSVALAGGPATSIAFGGMFEKMGVAGATAVAMASATFGIVVAGLIGGYIGGWLIRRHGLKSGLTPGVTGRPAPSAFREAVSERLLATVLVMGVAMGLGNVVSLAMEHAGLILPSYIGAMIVAAAIRNLDDRYHFANISQPDVDMLGRIALYLFIVMALLTLRLWELAHLALPLIVILAAQVALCWLMCATMSFRVMGGDYDSAIMASGFCGYMLGITANAVACMEELVEKYGPAPEAFLVVPVVGAFLIDFTNSLIITTMANWLR